MKATPCGPRWLGWILAGGLILSAVPAGAKKPPKPPPEPPPSPGPAYRIVAVEGAISPSSISDTGVLVGEAIYEHPDWTFQSPAILPKHVIDGQVQYPADALLWLPDVDGEQEYGTSLAMNEAGVAVGYMDPGIHRAILWLADGTAVNLGVDPAGLSSSAHDINDAGLVLAGIGKENDPGEIGGVLVPMDVDADGEPDTWFMDLDADGMNDLFFPTDAGHNLLPLVINDTDQVLSAQVAGGDQIAGYLVTPDFSDADGDGNPWFADADADGFNDLLMVLEPPEPGASVAVAGLNNLGQVAGNSGGHVVRWQFMEGVQIVTDLGSLSRKANMRTAGISDSGRMVGTSRIPAGRHSKAGPSWLIEDDTMYELLPLIVNADGWSDLSAGGINRDGWIHGEGRFDGIQRRFVAVPIDEP